VAWRFSVSALQGFALNKARVLTEANDAQASLCEGDDRQPHDAQGFSTSTEDVLGVFLLDSHGDYRNHPDHSRVYLPSKQGIM
jgi:hypothetical protein